MLRKSHLCFSEGLGAGRVLRPAVQIPQTHEQTWEIAKLVQTLVDLKVFQAILSWS